MVDLLKDFTLGDWCYESKHAYELLEAMHPNDRMSFNFNTKTIDWQMCSYLMLYGIQKNMMKMDVAMPNDQKNLINKVSVRFFEDSALFLAKCSKIKNVNLARYIEKVVFSDRVQTQLKLHNSEASHNTHNAQNYRQLMKESKLFLESCSSQIDS